MLVRDWSEWIHEEEGGCREITVNVSPAIRISEILGPDGEPLMFGYERRKVGFDLTPQK